MDFATGEDVIALKAVVQDIADPTSDGELAEEADEYARSTGLTVDSRYWPTAIQNDMLMASTLAPTRPGTLLELPDLPECAFRSIITLPEQLSIPKPAIEFAENVVKTRSEADIDRLVTDLSSTANSDTIPRKLEEPLLRSGPEADQRALASKLTAFRQTSLQNHRLPLHPVNIEDDEGLEFPDRAYQGHHSLMDTIKMQKYDAKFSMVSYIHKTNEAPWSDDEQRQVFESVATYQGLADQGYMTPPLSPCIESHTEPADYFVPDPEICLVPEPSPVCSRLEMDIEAAERRIFKPDTDFCESLVSGETYSLKSCGFDYDDLDISGMIRAGEVPLPDDDLDSVAKVEDLKLEIPLLPDDKIVDLTREPQQIIKPEDLEQAKELIKSEDEPAITDQRFSDFLQSKSDKMMRTAEQEKLSSIDSTARVPIPVMDFSVPKPDWSEGGCDTPAKMFSWIKKHNEHINWNPMRWPSNRAAEQRMVWSPMAHMWDTKKLVSEQIEMDDNLLRQFMVLTLDRDVLSSGDCLVKRHGLSVLRDYNLEDELLDEEDVFQRNTGLSTMATSRYGSTGLRDGVSSSYGTSIVDELVTDSSRRQAKAGQATVTASRYETTGPGDGIMSEISIIEWMVTESERREAEAAANKKRARRDFDEEDGWTKTAQPTSSRPGSNVVPSRDSQAADIAMMDSASALRSFVDEGQWDDHSKLVQNHAKRYSFKKPKVNSRFFGSSQDPSSDEIERLVPSQKREEDDARAMPPPPKPINALAPAFTLPDAPPKIIVSSSVSHMLILELRGLIPGFGVISRDYTRWTHTSGPKQLPGSRPLSLENMEADITLSPATGILLTTMVKLRQRSFPGMSGTGAGQGNDFRQVVEKVTLKYETLMVFISEGSKHSESITPLNGSDSKALVEFQAWAVGLSSSSSLGCKITVVYIGGGNETLARHVAATICRYVNEGSMVVDPLLEEETCWEVFLRRAGMNAFGAQAVLGLLKNTEAEDDPAIGQTGRLYGLPLFVMMNVEERIAMFGHIFGGKKVLERVSEALDGEWGPQSHESRPMGMMLEERRHQRGPEDMRSVQAAARPWASQIFQGRI